MKPKRSKIPLFPKTKKDWDSFMETAFTGTALVIDVLLTKGILQFLTGIGFRVRADRALNELKDLPKETKEEVQSKLSKNYLKSDEFLVFCSYAMTEAMRLKNIEKIKYFRSAIINGMLKNDLEEGKKLLFTEALSNLSKDSITLLALIDKRCVKDRDARLNFRLILTQTEYKDPGYLVANLKALDRYNLLEVDANPSVREAGEQHYYDTIPVTYRQLGKDFISFIMDYS